MTHPRDIHDAHPSDEGALEAEWSRQERSLRRWRDAAAVGFAEAEPGGTDSTDAKPATSLDPVEQAERALFAALAREPLPALPADFAHRTAVAAERQAMARRQVARFRRLLGVLLGACYLPAMVLAALLSVPGAWSSPASPQAASLGGWLLAAAMLGVLSLLADRWRSRSTGDGASAA